MTLPNFLEFLTASRFWALVIGAVAIYLKGKGIIGEPEMQLIATLSAVFITVRTIDKNVGEAKIISAGVSTGNVATEDVANIPPIK